MSDGRRQHKSISTRLQPYNINVVTSLEEFINDPNGGARTITLQCSSGHIFTVKTTSLGNDFSKVQRGLKKGFCAECNKPETEKLNVIDVCNNLGFDFISYNNRYVIYKCVCGAERKSHASNLLRPDRQAQCLECQNISNRNSIETVRKTFTDAGCKLLSKYTSRHKPVKFKCQCGTIAKIRYSDFVRGRRCNAVCKQQKYKEYYQKNHGVDNVFQLEETKAKSRKTCMEKYGVEYCMQNPEIFHKAKRKCYNNKRIITQGDYSWVIEGYEHHCLKDLLQEYKPENIKTGKDVPSINYVADDGVNRVWYPDFYLPSVDVIIEVKSTYTYDCDIQGTTAKIQQCPYDCELRVYNKKGVLLDTVYNVDGEIYSSNGLVTLGDPIYEDRS